MKKKLLNMCLLAIMMAFGMSAYALEKKDGVYQIGSAEDYYAFVELVNGGERGANAILTADIDLGTNNAKIATNNSNYLGTFDGAGHTITINFSEGTDGEGPALFRSIDQRAIIKRLKVQGTLRASKYKHTAAIANYSSGIIRDCYVDVHVEANFADDADASIGGIAGQLNKLSVLENCLSKIKITGSTTHKCGGIAAWVDAERANISNCLVINDEESNFNWSDGKSAGLVRDGDGLLEVLNLETYNADSYKNRPKGASANNYVTNDWGKLGKAATVVSSADVASGKVCYQLNSDQSQIRWVQRIGTDPYPVPAVFGTGRVYASAATNCQGMADGAITYSNTGSDTATKHTYDKYGVCTTCGQFNWNAFDFNDPERFDISDKSFLISSGSDLFLAETWNRFQNGCKFNLKLTNDVECKPEPGQVIFNTNDWIESNFNGQGHTLTIEMVDINEESAAFFPKPYANKGDFVFENVIMHGKVSSAYTKKGYVGSIASREYGSGSNKMIYRNVYSDVEVSVATEGDNTSAGFLGVADRTTVFENCIYAGNVNCVEGGGGVAGIVGWANGSTTTLTNCAFIGTLNNAGDGSTTLIRNYSTQTYKNVYSLNSYVDEGENSKFTLLENEDAIKSGELAYLLNGREEGLDRFYQKIGEDPVPMPFKKEGALVYTTAENYGCDGKPIGDVTYSNTYSAIVPSHQYSDGMCTICGHLEENYVPLVDGWYEIGNAAQFMWWARYAAEEDLSASARLTADIDMEEYSATYPDRTYPQIGNETTPFYGNFDGQYHTISNLEINLPGKRGAGLIGVMNSQPSNGFGGLSADDARAAEGVFVKNVVLDETCSILGQGYTGVVGMAANWPGHITISGVLNMGDATVDGGTNGAGLFGCAMGSNCHMTINNCGFIGDIHVLNNTQTENGSFSGWLGSYAEVTNCFSMGTVEYPDPHRSWARHPAGANIVIKNCYGLEGSDLKEFNDDAETKPDDVTFIPKEEIESGALAWKANGGQFRNPVWYQNIEEDENPSPIPSHGLVIYGAEKYFSALADGDIPGIASEIGSYEEDKAEGDIIATQALLDEWKVAAAALGESTTILGLADAFDALDLVKASVQKSATVYQSYIDKCEEVKTFLKNDKTFSGNLRTSLEAYLSENEEPSEANPLGTYEYIIEEHTATTEEIANEIERVDEWLKHAIAEDYVPGTDISWLIPNSDFAKKNTEYWTGAWCNSFGTVKNENGKDVVGVEAWNRTGDMYQTVEGMKPGYYLIGLSGAFRPSNNRYSTNYAAGVYANGIFNYFPTVIEDYIAVKDTIDQVNCNLHGQGALDLAIYDDFNSTDEEQAENAGAGLLGYAVHGPYGMAAAANDGRYQAYTIAYVGEDGKLTIGIKNQGTKYGNDWTGWGPIKVVYYGEEADDALDTVLKNMKARAQSIIDYTIAKDIEDPAATPNFPAELRTQLKGVIDAIDTAESVETKNNLAKQFSELFQEVYEGKRAYVTLYKYASTLENIEGGNLPLVEKDGDGNWSETGEMIFSKADCDAIFAAYDAMYYAFRDGTFSTEQALDPSTGLTGDVVEVLANIMPKMDDEKYYLITNSKQFVTYRSLFLSYDQSIKAKLMNDIDMIGIGMQPFGNNTEGTEDKGISYSGTLDGQGHALENVYIKFFGGRGCALFYDLTNATVKNLKLTGEYYGDMQRMGGLTRYVSGNTNIENCEIAVVMHTDIEGDATTGGVMGCCRGSDNVVNNCLINCTFIGENAHSFGGVCGWRDGTLNVTNVLILSKYETASEPTSYPSDVIARNSCNLSNVYYAEQSLIPGASARGTKATDAQLTSGEICYRLNGDKQGDNAVWFQTLGEDANPVLDKTHKLVLYDVDRGYYNEAEDPDAIENLTPSVLPAKGTIYNLSGQRVSRAQKGIYIIDGKKVAIK
jgi:hypothetical protein